MGRLGQSAGELDCGVSLSRDTGPLPLFAVVCIRRSFGFGFDVGTRLTDEDVVLDDLCGVKDCAVVACHRRCRGGEKGS